MSEQPLKEYALSPNKMVLQDTLLGIHYEFCYDYTEPNGGNNRFVHLNLQIIDVNGKSPLVLKNIPLTSWLLEDFVTQNLFYTIFQALKDVYYCADHTETRLQNYTSGGLKPATLILANFHALTYESYSRVAKMYEYLSLKYAPIIEGDLTFDDNLGSLYTFRLNLTEKDKHGDAWVYIDVDWVMAVEGETVKTENNCPIGWKLSEFKEKQSITIAQDCMVFLVPYLEEKQSRKSVGFDATARKLCTGLEWYIRKAIDKLTSDSEFSE